jgi:putative intracellular protease/amidase
VTCQGQTGPTHSILDSATAVGFTDTFDAATNGLGVTSASGAVYLEAVGATTAEFTLDGVNGGYRTATCSGAV